MAHQQQGCPPARQATQVLQQLMPGPDVQTVGGFVEHQHFRIVHQRPRQQEAAFLAFGKVGKGLLSEIRQVDLPQQCLHPFPLRSAGLLIASQTHRSEKTGEHQLMGPHVPPLSGLGIL